MKFRIKIFSWVLFFVFLPCSFLFSADLDIPLPKGTVKVLERKSEFGPIKSFTQVFKSPLNSGRLMAFYKKELSSDGWKEKNEGAFIKGRTILVIVCDPVKNKEKDTEFTITLSNIPPKEEFLFMRKATPDKLSYMPIYPGSAQICILHMPAGIGSAYETGSSVEEVVFFYKTGMLNYGWSLDEELFPSSAKVILSYSKLTGETCVIEVSGLTGDAAMESSGFLSSDNNKETVNGIPSVKTTIMANYHAYTKIRP